MLKPICSSKSLLGLEIGGLYITNKLLQTKQILHLTILDYSFFTDGKKQ
jgi:hypothetical protein